MKSILSLILLVLLAITSLTASEEVPTQEEVAKLYVATFNRAPDSSGLDYWVNCGLKLSGIAQSFFDQEETKALYPTDTSNRDFINSVYQNLFNRVPDTAGWDYWEEELNKGAYSKNLFIQTVINGAKDSDTSNDATILANKNEVGLYFASKGLSDNDEAKRVMEEITDNRTAVLFIKDKITANNLGADAWNGVENYVPSEDTSASETITHNGLTYKTITSEVTGKIWLDRNIGASQVCITFDDESCYGDYYQWGRAADGHEKSYSSHYYESSDSINPGHKTFINNLDDWTNADSDGSLRTANWSKTDGSSVCPVGFRVPTIEELQNETIDVSNLDDEFNNFLKLPTAGYRDDSSASIYNDGWEGYIWSVSTSEDKYGYSQNFYFTTYKPYLFSSNRSKGYPIRCLKGA